MASFTEETFDLYGASEEQRNDRVFVMKAVDRAIVIKAVQKDGCALQCASEDLRNDREVVFAAVQQNGLYTMALWGASNDFIKDREFMKNAIQHNARSIAYAHRDLRNDELFWLNCIEINHNTF